MLLIVLAGWTLFTFIMIWIYGHVTVYEDNLWVRGVETILLAAVVIFGMYAFVKSYKEMR